MTIATGLSRKLDRGSQPPNGPSPAKSGAACPTIGWWKPSAGPTASPPSWQPTARSRRASAGGRKGAAVIRGRCGRMVGGTRRSEVGPVRTRPARSRAGSAQYRRPPPGRSTSAGVAGVAIRAGRPYNHRGSPEAREELTRTCPYQHVAWALAFVAAVAAPAPLRAEIKINPSGWRFPNIVTAEKEHIMVTDRTPVIPGKETINRAYRRADGSHFMTYEIEGRVFGVEIDEDGKPPFEYSIMDTDGDGKFETM